MITRMKKLIFSIFGIILIMFTMIFGSCVLLPLCCILVINKSVKLISNIFDYTGDSLHRLLYASYKFTKKLINLFIRIYENKD